MRHGDNDGIWWKSLIDMHHVAFSVQNTLCSSVLEEAVVYVIDVSESGMSCCMS